jgi:hypothetical protein
MLKVVIYASRNMNANRIGCYFMGIPEEAFVKGVRRGEFGEGWFGIEVVREESSNVPLNGRCFSKN